MRVAVEVNAAVVQGSIAFLPGETCRERSGQESAEAIVVGVTSRSADEHSKIAGGLTQRRADVVLSLCVFDQIKHTEAVTGVTASRVGGLRPWAFHGCLLGRLCRTSNVNFVWLILFGFGFPVWAVRVGSLAG